MRGADFAAILDRIHGYTNYLVPHVLGEALLHPELPFLLDCCQEHGLRVNLATNGLLLAQQGPLLLVKPALRQLNISLHSFEAGSEAELDEYLGTILTFVREARASSSLLISLRMWNLTANSAAAERLWSEEILRRLAQFFQLPAAIAAHPTSQGHGLTLAPGVFLSQDRRFNWPHGAGEDLGGRGFCRALRDHLAILVDGTVVPCCLDGEGDIALGNIHQQPLAELLAQPRAQAIYQGFSEQRVVESLCRRCGYRLRFTRPG